MPFAEWQTIKGRFSIRHPTASSFFCSSSVKSSFSCETASAAGADDDCFGSRGGSSNGTTKSSAAQSARHYQQVTLKPRPVWKLLLALLWYQSTYICTERLDNACEPTVTNAPWLVCCCRRHRDLGQLETLVLGCIIVCGLARPLKI